MKNGIEFFGLILTIVTAITLSSYSYGQLGSSLNQAKNNAANVDFERRRLDLSGFRDEPLDLGDSEPRIIIRENKERSTFDDIILQIQTIFWNEMPKYSNFYYRDQPPTTSTPTITDETTNENGDQVVIGEYTYNNDYYNVNYDRIATPSHSFIFNATIKKVFDKYTVKKIIYKKEGQWFRLFPENEDIQTENRNTGQTSTIQRSGVMVTIIEACFRITDSADSDCIKILPRDTRVTVLQKEKFGDYLLVKHDQIVGYILASSLRSVD